MRKRLFLLIFTIIFITAAVISLLIGNFSYDFVKTVLRENREETIYRIEKQLDHYQSILDSIEKDMDRDGQTALLKLINRYPNYNSASKADPVQLKNIAKNSGIDHVYFIDSAGIVFNSSLSSDIGINLFSISSTFGKYLDTIYGKGETVSQGITVSTREGRITHYMYYSPRGSSIIYEISFDVIDFVNRKYNFALYEFLFGDMFKTFQNEYLQSIEIYSITGRSAWSLINSGKGMDLSPQLAEKIIRDESVVVESADKIHVYKKMKMNRYFFNRISNVYFELVYDVSILKRYLKNIMLYSVLMVVIITAAAFYMARKRMNSLFISRIMNIIESLKIIKAGDYNTVITDVENDEISDIAANINQLAKTVSHRSAELHTRNEEMRELGLYVNDIIESMPSIIITLDADDRIIHWNREAEKFTGYSSGEAVERILWDFIPVLGRYRGVCDEVRKKKITVELPKEVVLREDCGTEESLIKNIYIFPFSKKDIPGVIIRIDDITELEKKEERLNRASRIEALGTMAGGLAHDFNNIITGIISTASYLDIRVRDKNITEEEIAENLVIIKQSGGKAAQLVKNLMSVSKNEEEKFSTINLSEIVEDVIAITRSSVFDSAGIKFYNKYPESFMRGNRSQIEQVVLNLIVNASEAMRGDGNPESEPEISLALDRLDKPEMLRSFSGPVWHLSVADNGPGIGRDKIKKIFDPFFTTKSEGSGLGLAVVHNIVIRHNGLIEVHSEPGSGTVFDIFLPADV